MRLRADPPRVTRISRKVNIGLGIIAGLGIGAALIYGLQRPDRTAAPEELITTDRRQPADGLRDLPGSYDAIPRLGPPPCRATSAAASSTRSNAANPSPLQASRPRTWIRWNSSGLLN